MFDASDRKQVREREKRAKLRETQVLDFLRASLTTEQGRAFFWDLLERTHVFRLSMGPDELATAFAEGERNIGIPILNQITIHCPELFVQMMQEQNSPVPVEPRTEGDEEDADRSE